MSKYCVTCHDTYRSKYEAGCYGSCGKRDCEHCCSNCGQHSLIESEVIRTINELSISKHSPVLRILQSMKEEVDRGDKNEFSWVIEQRTVSGYWGKPMVLSYNRNSGVITKHSFYTY